MCCISLIAKPITPPHPNQPFVEVDKRDDSPFISSRSFMRISDFIIDRNTPFFDPDWVNQGDLIFVDSYYLPWFERDVHDQIKAPYILISRVEEWPSGVGTMKKLIHDPKLVTWFCWNLLFSYHPKLIQIPMGQDVFSWNYEGPEKFLEKINHPPPKDHLLYMNHCPRLFGDRYRIVKLFEKEPYCFSKNHSEQEYKLIDKEEYLDDLATSYFTLSPIGLAIECMRTWEAVVLGCIPILVHSFQDPLFDGLPVLLVHDWNEINQDFLLKKQKDLGHLNHEKAYFNYWKKQILDAKTKVINGDLSSSQVESTRFSSRDINDLISILENSKSLTYKGLLTTIRPQQLLQENPSLDLLFLQDPWNNSTDGRIVSIQSDNDLQKGSPIFLDLTYFRSSLFRNNKYWQHSLKKDIKDLYAKLTAGTLLCGNMIQNEYVREVLHRLSEETGIRPKSKGDFWFLIK
jgi:hypothetical protein